MPSLIWFLYGILARVSYVLSSRLQGHTNSCPGHTPRYRRPGEDPNTQRSPHLDNKFGPGPSRQRYVWDRNTVFPLSRWLTSRDILANAADKRHLYLIKRISKHRTANTKWITKSEAIQTAQGLWTTTCSCYPFQFVVPWAHSCLKVLVSMKQMIQTDRRWTHWFWHCERIHP